MTPTGVLLVTPIFLWGVDFASLLAGRPRVALALHNARCGTPFGVTTVLGSTCDVTECEITRVIRQSFVVDCTRTGSLL